MKKLLSLGALLTVAMSLQSCVAYVYGPAYGPGYHWHHGYHHGPYPTAMDNATTDSSANSASLLAEHYGISQHSAEMIADFAAGQNTSVALKATGISEADLAPLKSHEIPSAETIQTIAKNLGENDATITAIFTDFVADTKSDS